MQKISSQVEIIRDKHLLKTISEKAANYRNIVIVYGSSHFSTQYDILSRMYGPAKFLKEADVELSGLSSDNIILESFEPLDF